MQSSFILTFEKTLMYRIMRYGVALTVALLSLTTQADLQEQLDALEPGKTT